jgi:hypothetical protein
MPFNVSNTSIKPPSHLLGEMLRVLRADDVEYVMRYADDDTLRKPVCVLISP